MIIELLSAISVITAPHTWTFQPWHFHAAGINQKGEISRFDSNLGFTSKRECESVLNLFYTDILVPQQMIIINDTRTTAMKVSFMWCDVAGNNT